MIWLWIQNLLQKNTHWQWYSNRQWPGVPWSYCEHKICYRKTYTDSDTLSNRQWPGVPWSYHEYKICYRKTYTNSNTVTDNDQVCYDLTVNTKSANERHTVSYNNQAYHKLRIQNLPEKDIQRQCHDLTMNIKFRVFVDFIQSNGFIQFYLWWYRAWVTWKRQHKS